MADIYSMPPRLFPEQNAPLTLGQVFQELEKNLDFIQTANLADPHDRDRLDSLVELYEKILENNQASVTASYVKAARKATRPMNVDEIAAARQNAGLAMIGGFFAFIITPSLALADTEILAITMPLGMGASALVVAWGIRRVLALDKIKKGWITGNRPPDEPAIQAQKQLEAIRDTRNLINQRFRESASRDCENYGIPNRVLSSSIGPKNQTCTQTAFRL